MENNYSSADHSPVFDEALSLPHFDEDATLLLARPVVPLHKVKAQTASSRRVIFGLAILAAIVLGAVTATLLLMQRVQNPESAVEAEPGQPTVSSSGAAGGASSEPAEARPPVVAKRNEQPSREMPHARDSSINKQPPAVSRIPVKPARAGTPNRQRDGDFESDERELRRAERRNARREARRERLDRRDQAGDELLRIREIFEGSPRP